MDNVVKDLNQLDNLADIGGEVDEIYCGVDFSRLGLEATTKVWKSLHNRESILRQKSISI